MLIVCEILEEIGVCKNEQKYAIIRRFRTNYNKTAVEKPLPVKVTFGKDITDMRIEDVLKKAKALKDSLKFKSVFFGKDLTVTQIVRLKQLIKTRNEENSKLDAKNKVTKTTETFRYGVRNDMVVKVFLNN